MLFMGQCEHKMIQLHFTLFLYIFQNSEVALSWAFQFGHYSSGVLDTRDKNGKGLIFIKGSASNLKLNKKHDKKKNTQEHFFHSLLSIYQLPYLSCSV